MINFFRSFFQSKIGLALTIGFLVLIALAFASADVSTTGTFGGLSGTNNVAVVGKEEVTTAELRQSADNAFRQVQQSEPTLSLEEFIADGGLEQVFDTLLDRVSISEFGRILGLRAGDNLINSEIRMIPAFAGPDGNFSDDVYRSAIRSQGLTDQIVREDLTDGLIARQVLIPAVFGAQFPESVTRRYATQLRERREGSIALVPAEFYVPEEDPSDEQLQAFYRENRDDFIRPERRQVRYAAFGADALGDRIEPTQAEIRQRYEQNEDDYSASEERTFTQLIVPTREAAQSIRSRVEGGASLSAAAREAGLDTSEMGPIRREDYAQQANPAVANAVFSAEDGAIADIARSPLGFHVVRIDDVTEIPARSLAQVRDEILTALRTEKQRRALNELASEVEDRINSGESFREVAEALDLDIETTRPLIASGQVFGGEQGETAPELVQPLVPTVFQMQEGQPQIAQVQDGQTFVLFEPASITRSAAPPLAEIREEVGNRWKLARGAEAAEEAAARILKRVRDGSTLAAAMRAEDKPLPPARPLNVTRDQLQQQQQPNPPVALMFAMTEGTAKRIEAPGNAGYFLVALDEITAGELEEGDPLIAQAQRGYGELLSREYGDQLRVAIRNDIGVQRSDEAIAAVERDLTGARN
ncbi:peptidylprolyl isomerase [Alteriqipengyuania lutimaris]|uniref:Parvulin-like PPIase n=1 Tax=Alteriqipengyuania lutimaris TaxID=1538146 RepID=A0A395LM21_9SPHN|nr:peptidyl-prolyl cis-trans isomerase [Alteriqipengyuania lutimaris]MBB3032821.1 peptidyl-prolyl cis-trans isomerase D [Alteriqipengyuania lutimaris]RDS78083.1 peptidylprolyl isomerase [Alteriqipengyuania lutimaris]